MSAGTKGPTGSKSVSAIGGVAAIPGPSMTGVETACSSGPLERSLSRGCLLLDGPARDSWSCQVGGRLGFRTCCERDLKLGRLERVVLSDLEPPASVSGVAGIGSSYSSGVKVELRVVVLLFRWFWIERRGFLLRRCKLASSAASAIEGGETGEDDRLRRPDTERSAGWGNAVLDRAKRLGVAKVGLPFSDSNAWSFPLEVFRFRWRFRCYKEHC